MAGSGDFGAEIHISSRSRLAKIVFARWSLGCVFPREAAFNSVEKVKAASKEVAVVQRRESVLLTMAGPDTVKVECFPVPAHGEMKIRLGITDIWMGIAGRCRAWWSEIMA